mmetsp:Transcript_144952/g.361558  ORF Transcript_144952/g.361558 Transcript_144952/m.361558 type:complete len:281 (+) Transcript_144952:992-1834(+)
MPIPTCAPWIMGTSLAPSPIASVIAFGFCMRTSSTSSRFCIGESRQHTHELLATATSYSAVFALASDKMWPTDLPSRTMACLRGMPFNESSLLERGTSLSLVVHSRGDDVSTTLTIFMPASSNLHDLAISTAVSTLSPVSTHTRIPASRSVAIVDGTRSCNRSSRAVMPTYVRPSSMAAASRSSLALRSSMALFASAHRARQAEKSAGGMVLRATTSVRRPCRENSAKAWVACAGSGSLSKPAMTLSAPLVVTTALPSLRAATTLMRARSEVKPRTWVMS